MSAKSYVLRFNRQGFAGQEQEIVTVTNVSTGDTVTLSDFAFIQNLMYLQVNNTSMQFTSLASTTWASNVFTVPSTPSIPLGGAFDLLVIGAAANAS